MSICLAEELVKNVVTVNKFPHLSRHPASILSYNEPMTKIVLKNDQYRTSRAGHTYLFNISCEECGRLVCLYQKDGRPGHLRRMYIDRMSKNKVPTSGQNLTCPKGHILGRKIIYEKENRPAFRLFVDAVIKKITKVS